MSSKHLCLSVDGQVPGKTLRHDPGDEGCARHAAIDQPWRRRRLDDTGFALAAGIFGANSGDHPQDGRHDIQHLADILTDTVHVALAAGTLRTLWLDDVGDPRKMLRQAADVAPRLTRRPLSGTVVVGRFMMGDRAQIAEIEAFLGVEDDAGLFRARPEEHGLEADQKLVGRLKLRLQFDDFLLCAGELRSQIWMVGRHRHPIAGHASKAQQIQRFSLPVPAF